MRNIHEILDLYIWISYKLEFFKYFFSLDLDKPTKSGYIDFMTGLIIKTNAVAIIAITAIVFNTVLRIRFFIYFVICS